MTNKRGRRRDGDEADSPVINKTANSANKCTVDWITLPDDTIINIFSCLNYRDRACLSATCRTFRGLAKSTCLWQELDMRFQKRGMATSSLASRCQNLQRLRFRHPEFAAASIDLEARNLRQIIAEGCQKLCDATLAMLVARHEALVTLHVGERCENISPNAVKAIALCCKKLQRLCLMGLIEVDAYAINALGKHCPYLTDIGFVNCHEVDEAALGNVTSLRFLSLAGTITLNWNSAAEYWSKLPNLISLDVSRTNIPAATIFDLSSSCIGLKVLCAFGCPDTEFDPKLASNKKLKGKTVLAMSTDVLKGLATVLGHTPKDNKNVFLEWRNFQVTDKGNEGIVDWLESVISAALLCAAEYGTATLYEFWLRHGTTLLLSFMQSPRVEIQERAARTLAGFIVLVGRTTSIDTTKAEAVMQCGGIRVLLNLARSWRVGLQMEAAKAIANFSVDPIVAKAVVNGGGVSVLINLTRSENMLVAEEAATGLCNLAIREENKDVFYETGGLKALVDLLLKWMKSSIGEGVTVRAAGALANLAADENCSVEIVSAGGLHALVTLARTSNLVGVHEQACRAIANLAAHGDKNGTNATIGQEEGVLEALVGLTNSSHERVRQEAAGALWNLSYDERNREAIAAANGVEALVALLQSCSNSSHGLQERFSVLEANRYKYNSTAIGQRGVTSLNTLARSYAEDVQETATGALWNLAFNPNNARRIVESGGSLTLRHLCSSSVSQLARFMSTLVLAYMCDRRLSRDMQLDDTRKLALEHIDAFLDTYRRSEDLAAAAASSAPAALAQATIFIRISEAGLLRCSGNEVARFLAMLRNPLPTMKGCAAFALAQFTMAGGRHTKLHAELLEKAGGSRVVCGTAAAAGAPFDAKIYARIVLRNLEQASASAN